QLAQFMRERTNVSSGAAFHYKARDRTFHACEAEFEYFHFHRLQSYRLIFPREFMRRTTAYFLRRICGRSLLNLPGKARRIGCEFVGVQRGSRVRTERFSIGVIRIGLKTETHRAGVAFAASSVETRQARGAPQRQHQHARGLRIERAQMADAAKSRELAHGFDDVVRSLSRRLIDNQNSIGGWLFGCARHEWFLR